MTYDVLIKLKAQGLLDGCSIAVSDKDSMRRHRTILGRDIARVTRSSIEFRGGETGHEILSVPIESILEIEYGGKVIYRKKKRIERIYPR